MPFTFAHPSIILPLKQARPQMFSLTGLVAGSMAPDFEYFLKVHASSTISETFTGIFTFNIPVATAISVLFHLIVRNSLIIHFPRPFDRRFSGYLNFNFLRFIKENPIKFFLSALIGVLSHLLLDLLTSPETMTHSFHKLQQIRLSQTNFGLIAHSGFEPFILLERAFSIISLLLIGYILSKVNYPARHFTHQRSKQKRKFFSIFFAMQFMGLIAGIYFLPYQISASQVIVNIISAGLLSLIVTSLLFWKDGQFAARD